jgi:hypothetical protein
MRASVALPLAGNIHHNRLLKTSFPLRNDVVPERDFAETFVQHWQSSPRTTETRGWNPERRGSAAAAEPRESIHWPRKKSAAKSCLTSPTLHMHPCARKPSLFDRKSNRFLLAPGSRLFRARREGPSLGGTVCRPSPRQEVNRQNGHD